MDRKKLSRRCVGSLATWYRPYVLKFLLVLALPFFIVRAVMQRLLGHLPSRWSVTFAVAVSAIRFLLARVTGPLLQGKSLHLPEGRLVGSLARDVVTSPAMLGGCEAEWLSPRGSNPTRCVLYLHGGAFVTGSIGTHRRLMALLARAADARVIGINYRLAPQHPFPAGLEDCIAAYRELLDSGEDPRHIAIAGDSAGGGLTASTLLALKERNIPLPAAAWLISPALELGAPPIELRPEIYWDYLTPLLERVDALVPAYLGPNKDPSVPLVSPMNGELNGLPPILLHVGEYEVLHHQAQAFTEKAQAAGVNIELIVGPQMVHVYPSFAGLVREANEALREGAAFLQKHT